MSSFSKWIPYELACRLHCLQQGALNVGNTSENKAHLLTLIQTNANGAATYGRWSKAANAKNGTAQPVQALEVFPALVPGFVRPLNS
jgi:hypothetical protein